MISAGDVHLFHFVETAEEAWALLEARVRLRPAADTTTGDLRRSDIADSA